MPALTPHAAETATAVSRSLPRTFRSLRTRIIAAFTTLVLVLVAGLLTVVTIRTSDEGEKQGVPLRP